MKKALDVLTETQKTIIKGDTVTKAKKVRKSKTLDTQRQLTQSSGCKMKRKQADNKGKSFRSSLRSLNVTLDIDKSEGTNVETPNERSPAVSVTEDVISVEISGDKTGVNISAPGQSRMLDSKKKVDNGERGMEMGTLSHVQHHHDNFLYPRHILGESMFPEVDHTLVDYEICACNGTLITDPLNV